MSIGRKIARGAAVAATAAAAVVGTTLTAGTATAAPVPMFYQVMGSAIVPVPHGECHGSLEVRFEDVPHHRDRTEVTYYPTGTWGTLPGCEVPITLVWINGIFPFTHTHETVVSNGPTSTVIAPGQGISMMITGAQQLPSGLPSWATGGYMWLAP